MREVKAILTASHNLKHRAMLTLVYALGLRSGELIHLKIADVDGERKAVHLKGAKGHKDRLLPLPDNLRDLLREYYLSFRISCQLKPDRSIHLRSANLVKKATGGLPLHLDAGGEYLFFLK